MIRRSAITCSFLGSGSGCITGSLLVDKPIREDKEAKGLEAVCMSQWVLPGRGDWRRGERGRPGLSGQAWCYVVCLVFPHVSFPAQRNEWLPTGLWLWPRLKEYTYQGPEYTRQPVSQPAWPVNTSNPPIHLLQTGSVTLCHISHNEKMICSLVDIIPLIALCYSYCRCLPAISNNMFPTQQPKVKWQEGWLSRGGSMLIQWAFPSAPNLTVWYFPRDFFLGLCHDSPRLKSDIDLP